MLELGLWENLSFQAMDRLCERTDDLFRKNEFRVSILSENVVFFLNMMRSDNIVITLVFGSFYSFSGVNKRCNLVCVSAYDSIVSYEIEIYCKQRVIELQCVVYTFFFSLLYLHLC